MAILASVIAGCVALVLIIGDRREKGRKALREEYRDKMYDVIRWHYMVSGRMPAALDVVINEQIVDLTPPPEDIDRMIDLGVLDKKERYAIRHFVEARFMEAWNGAATQETKWSRERKAQRTRIALLRGAPKSQLAMLLDAQTDRGVALGYFLQRSDETGSRRADVIRLFSLVDEIKHSALSSENRIYLLREAERHVSMIDTSTYDERKTGTENGNAAEG